MVSSVSVGVSWWKKYWSLKYDLKTQVGRTGQIRRGLWDGFIAVRGNRASHVLKWKQAKKYKMIHNDSTRLDLKINKMTGMLALRRPGK
jgi:hypothetical protein